MSKDALGERMKENFENRTRFSLPRRTYTIIRLDGKAFHTLTKGFDKPFDKDIMNLMLFTTGALCEQIQGVAFAYTQSDEISLVLTDFTNPQTEAWFDGNIQKMASIAASIATLAFNKAISTEALEQYMLSGFNKGKLWNKDGSIKSGLFDARVFSIPDVTEVRNYFIWRQQDCVRNSVQMAAQSQYSQKELHGKNSSQLQDLLFQKGINWNDYTAREKRGTVFVKQTFTIEVPTGPVQRKKWIPLGDTPHFTAPEAFFAENLPVYPTKE